MEPFVAVDDVVFTEVDAAVDIDVTENDSDDSDEAVVALEIVAHPEHDTVELGVEDGEPSDSGGAARLAPAAASDDIGSSAAARSFRPRIGWVCP